jgi:hypothetical protein
MALQNLEHQRVMARRNNQSQLQQSLGALNQNMAGGFNQGNHYGSGFGQQRGNPGLGALAPLLMQQFMKGRGNNQRSNQQNQW